MRLRPAGFRQFLPQLREEAARTGAMALWLRRHGFRQLLRKLRGKAAGGLDLRLRFGESREILPGLRPAKACRRPPIPVR